ncbi:MAG TPA: hypothetical protein VNU01_01090 [Egibacteraceae bacterium]|nr:hypothetical protein [Egibacteraceae bacterium]
MDDPVQLLVALAVAGMLGRAAAPAWRNRVLAIAVWRRIRPVHVLGCVGLLAVVLATALTLMRFVPFASWGLGSLIGLDGNAVFAPLQEATELAEQARQPGAGGAAAPAAPGPDWVLLGIAGGFLSLLLVLFPWLAYVEERVFRAGLEHADLKSQVKAAFRFGIVHLVMLIPVGAALAIAVAGFVYGRIYRAAYRRALGAPPEFESPFGPRRIIETPARRARTAAVMTTTVWHTTFNSLIVLIVLAGFVLAG